MKVPCLFGMRFELFRARDTIMKYNSNSLGFLREKIAEMKVAIFKTELNADICLPNNLIETIQTDEEGNIYFFTSCNKNLTASIEQPFYAYLDYHQKFTEMHLRISGRAEIVDADAGEDGRFADLVMIKLKIMQAEYFGEQPEYNVMQKLRKTFTQWFSPAQTTQRYQFV